MNIPASAAPDSMCFAVPVSGSVLIQAAGLVDSLLRFVPNAGIICPALQPGPAEIFHKSDPDRIRLLKPRDTTSGGLIPLLHDFVENDAQCDEIIFLNPNLYFFADPAQLISTLRTQASLTMLTAQDATPLMVRIRPDESSLTGLRMLRKQGCADFSSLAKNPEHYQAEVIAAADAAAGPWSSGNFQAAENGGIRVGSTQPAAFLFSRFEFLDLRMIIAAACGDTGAKLSTQQIRVAYLPYFRNLLQQLEQLRSLLNDEPLEIASRVQPGPEYALLAPTADRQPLLDIPQIPVRLEDCLLYASPQIKEYAGYAKAFRLGLPLPLKPEWNAESPTIAAYLSKVSLLPSSLLDMIKQGQLREAEIRCRDALTEHPNIAPLHSCMGLIQKALSKPDLGAGEFQEALRLNPGDVIAGLNMLKILDKAEDAAALQDLGARMTDLLPNNRTLWKNWIRLQGAHYDRLAETSEIVRPGSAGKEYLITALVSTYKSSEFMEECLQDLEDQTLADRLEIMVVDAASPEDEGVVVREFQKRYTNIVYCRTPQRITVYEAWNLAVRLSSGRYLTTFSTNDRLRKEGYEMLADVLDGDANIALAFGKTAITSQPHQSFDDYTPSETLDGAFKWREYSLEYNLQFCTVGPHPMWRREVHDEIGWFDVRYPRVADQDFWLRMGRHYRLQYINEFTGLYWMDENALSQDAQAMQELLDIRARHNRVYAKGSFELAVLNTVTSRLEALIQQGKSDTALSYYESLAERLPRSEESELLHGLMRQLKG